MAGLILSLKSAPIVMPGSVQALVPELPLSKLLALEQQMLEEPQVAQLQPLGYYPTALF